MTDPVYKEFRYQVQALPSPDAECIQVLAQVMDLTFQDLSPQEKAAVAAWFTARYSPIGGRNDGQ